MTTYGSTREALAWLLTCEIGPAPRQHVLANPGRYRQRSRRTLEDLFELMAVAYGPDVRLTRSEADRDMRGDLLDFVTEKTSLDTLPPKARSLYGRLRRALLERGLLVPPAEPPALEVVESTVQTIRRVDPDGRPREASGEFVLRTKRVKEAG